MQRQTVTRQQVIELAATMPLEKLVTWYEYGLFIRERPLPVFMSETNVDSDLAEELLNWEAASDEDWIKIENELPEKQ